METCRECGKEFWANKPWQTFCCQAHQQQWHNQRRKERRHALAPVVPRRELRGIVEERFADAERHEPGKRRAKINGQDRGTPEQREAARQALVALTQGRGRPDVEAAEPAQVLRRRW